MYESVLKRLREETNQPVDPIIPQSKGLVDKKISGTEVSEPTDPLSTMREWMSIIRSNGDMARKKANREMEEALQSPSPSTVSRRRKVEPAPEETKTEGKRRSAFDAAREGSDNLDEFALDINDDLSLIREKEGFRDKPYWDVNHYRVGYGSDTVTKADGSVVKTEPGMKITREDAERDLARRTANIRKDIADKIGKNTWDNLPTKAKAALTSVAYNYGSLPKSVTLSAKLGDLNTIADAVANLASHNEGVNRKRRLQEAALIRSGV